MQRCPFFLLLCMVVIAIKSSNSFSILFMGARRRGKGNLKRTLDSSTESTGPPNAKSLNGGKGQEITGVSLPADGKIKGWEFGNKLRLACANVNGKFYAIQGPCPRCAFDLFRGDLVTDEEAFGPDVPRIACPTCLTTYSLKTGKHGSSFQRGGLAGFVGSLAKIATINDASKDASAFVITRDAETGRVYCRER